MLWEWESCVQRINFVFTIWLHAPSISPLLTFSHLAWNCVSQMWTWSYLPVLDISCRFNWWCIARHNTNLAISVLATAKIRSFPSFQEEVTDLLLEAMGKHPESNGFLVDGFPASIEQAKICEEKLGKPEWDIGQYQYWRLLLQDPWEKLYFRKIIVLEANDDVLMKRLEDGDNFNDALETIPKRIKTYRYKGVNYIV